MTQSVLWGSAPSKLHPWNAPNTPEVGSARGAPMGRRSLLPEDAQRMLNQPHHAWMAGLEDEHGKLKIASCLLLARGGPVEVILRRIPLDEGYDEGGAYWGDPDDLWGAGSKCGGVDLWFRAPDAASAARYVLGHFPGAVFEPHWG